MKKAIKRTTVVLSILALGFLITSCENEDGTVTELDDSMTAEGISAGPSPGPAIPVSDYFIVTHPDYRKCMWPMCGGFFVERVNTSVARCADGQWSWECHALEFDLSALGFSKKQEEKVLELIEAGEALVRGYLEKQNVGSSILGDVLVATEVWYGVTGNTPDGHFSRIDDTGAICITYPCPIYEERSLNTSLMDDLAGLDLASSGASSTQIAAALAELNSTGLLVVGDHSLMSGPAGTMNTLVAEEFYRRVQSFSIAPAP